MKISINSNSVEDSFLLSAFTEENCFQSTEEVKSNFNLDKKLFSVKQIPFIELRDWSFASGSGNLVHSSGKFFRIEGVRIYNYPGAIKNWEQPIINQPEVGILGIITKKFKGIRYFLMQAKCEPGNVNSAQLSPTVQATKSNYTQVHKGKQPLFLEFFRNKAKRKVLVDQLQSEQGARFLRKRNRNMIIEIEEEIDLPPDYYWLTLGQIKQLLKIDNFVNMDTRSVLSCVRFIDGNLIDSNKLNEGRQIRVFDQLREGFAKDLFVSLADKQNSLHGKFEIISWFTELKTRCECCIESISLNNVKHWLHTEKEIVHESKNFFSIMAVSVEAEGREIGSWSQPLLKQVGVGIIGFLIKKINGVFHFLVQAKVEAGYIDMIEMAPTVSVSNTENKGYGHKPYFAEFFINPSPERVILSVLLSEEGGRFYHSQNRYMVVEIESDRELDLPENYIWMTFGQLLEFNHHNNYINIETRSLLACLSFL